MVSYIVGPKRDILEQSGNSFYHFAILFKNAIKSNQKFRIVGF